MKKGISEEPMEPVITIVSGETETMLPRETVICSGSSSLVVMESTNIPGGDTLTSSSTAAAILKEQRKKLHMFRGTGNAIAVQLFAIDEKYEMRWGCVELLCCSHACMTDVMDLQVSRSTTDGLPTLSCKMNHHWNLVCSVLILSFILCAQDHDFLILSQPPSLPEFPLLTYFSVIIMSNFLIFMTFISLIIVCVYVYVCLCGVYLSSEYCRDPVWW